MSVAAIEPVVAEPQNEITYPESDGKPMGETGIHVRTTLHLYGALLNYFHRREDVYVAANMFLYYEEGNPKACRTPDVMVIYGVPSTPERRSFFTWREQAVPTIVFEITSKATWMEDLVSKSVLYARLGVEEYFIFDPLEEFLENTLQGFRLEDQDYVAIEAEDGSLYSEQLELNMRREDILLRLFDPITGEKVLSYEEMLAKVDAAVALADEASRSATEAERRAEEEAHRAEEEARKAAEEARRAAEEARRADAAEAENRRLRELLDSLRRGGEKN